MKLFWKRQLDRGKLRQTAQAIKNIQNSNEALAHAKKFSDFTRLVVVDRLIEIAEESNPCGVDTVVGIDRGGRGYAKLVKSTFDLIRERQGMGKAGLLFLNLHAGQNIDFSSTELDVLKGREYGHAFAIDDWTGGGMLRLFCGRAFEQLRKNGVKIDFVAHHYFATKKQDGFDMAFYFMVGEDNEISKLHLGGRQYLVEDKSISIFAKREKGYLDTVRILRTNRLINDLSSRAAEIYGSK